MRCAVACFVASILLAVSSAFAGEDTTPPVLLDFTIGPLVFDTSGGPATIDWCATASDDLSGVQSVGIVFGTVGVTSTVSGAGFPMNTAPVTRCNSFQVPQFSLFGTYVVGVSVNDSFQASGPPLPSPAFKPSFPPCANTAPCQPSRDTSRRSPPRFPRLRAFGRR